MRDTATYILITQYEHMTKDWVGNILVLLNHSSFKDSHDIIYVIEKNGIKLFKRIKMMQTDRVTDTEEDMGDSFAMQRWRGAKAVMVRVPSWSWDLL